MKKLACVTLACVFIWGCADRMQDAIETGQLNPGGSGEFSFVVMGSCSPQPGAGDSVAPNKLFVDSIDRCNAQRADFAVIAGDVISGRTGDVELLAKQWNAAAKALKRLVMPHLLVPGDRDVWDRESLRQWTQRFGRLYFSWDHKAAHFIALCSNVPGQEGQITGEQLKWLTRDLMRSFRSKRVFIFIHEPLWAVGGPEGVDSNAWNRDVHPLLVQYGVDTVFAGGWHRYCLFPTRDTVRYVMTGGGGIEAGPYELAGRFPHFVKVDVSPNKPTALSVVTPSKTLPPECVISEPLEMLTGGLEMSMDAATPGKIDLELTVPNPTTLATQGVLTWGHRGSTWKAVSTQTAIPAGKSGKLTAATTYQRLLDLPAATVELRAGKRRLFGWRDVLGRAISVSTVKRTRTVDVPWVGRIKIDGDAADWGDEGFRIEALSTVGRAVTNKGTFAPTVRLGWDDAGLLVHVTVRDDTISPAKKGKKMTDGDWVQVYVSSGPGARDVYSVIAAPPADAKTPQRIGFDFPQEQRKLRATVQTKLIPGGYAVETRLPWSNLHVKPREGRTLGVQVLVRDADADAPVVHQGWYPMGDPLSAGGLDRVCGVRLIDGEPSPPETLAVRAGTVLPIGSGIELVAPKASAGKKVLIKQGDKTLAQGVFRKAGGQARADITLGLSPKGTAFGTVDVLIDGAKATTVNLGGS